MLCSLICLFYPFPCSGTQSIVAQPSSPSDEGVRQRKPDIKTVKQEVDSYTINFSLAFLTIGSMRCTSDEAESILPAILLLVGAYCTRDCFLSIVSHNRSNQISHILLRLLDKIVTSRQLIVSKGLETTGEGDNDVTINSFQREESITELVQSLIQQDSVSSALYDILLDVFMYQSMPIDSDIPPPGLSPYGYERMKGGASTIGKDWREEYSSIHRLVGLKRTLLDWIAPTRSWDPFLISVRSGHSSSMNVCRGIGLLVIAVGEVHLDVSERAENFLKALFDRQEKTQIVFSVESKRHLIIGLLSLSVSVI